MVRRRFHLDFHFVVLFGFGVDAWGEGEEGFFYQITLHALIQSIGTGLRGHELQQRSDTFFLGMGDRLCRQQLFLGCSITNGPKNRLVLVVVYLILPEDLFFFLFES